MSPTRKTIMQFLAGLPVADQVQLQRIKIQIGQWPYADDRAIVISESAGDIELQLAVLAAAHLTGLTLANWVNADREPDPEALTQVVEDKLTAWDIEASQIKRGVAWLLSLCREKRARNEAERLALERAGLDQEQDAPTKAEPMAPAALAGEPARPARPAAKPATPEITPANADEATLQAERLKAEILLDMVYRRRRQRAGRPIHIIHRL